MRALVTGGSGFIGSNLVHHLHEYGHSVLNFDIRPPRDSRHESVWVEGDLTKRAVLNETLRSFKPTVVFHLGARTDLDGRSLDDYSANTSGTKNLIAAIADAESVEHTILASSRLVFDIDHLPAHDYDYRASTLYGRSKVEMERIVRAGAQSTSWTLVRPTSIWGPWFDVPYRDFFDAVRRGRFLKPAGVTIYKSFGYVGNAVHQLMAIARAPDTSRGKALWLCDYEPLELSQWADEIALGFGRRGPRSVRKSVLRFLAKVGDAMGRYGYSNPPITSFRLNNLLTNMVYDASRTEEIAGPLPFNRLAGVTETIAWLRR